MTLSLFLTKRFLIIPIAPLYMKYMVICQLLILLHPSKKAHQTIKFITVFQMQTQVKTICHILNQILQCTTLSKIYLHNKILKLQLFTIDTNGTIPFIYKLIFEKNSTPYLNLKRISYPSTLQYITSRKSLKYCLQIEFDFLLDWFVSHVYLKRKFVKKL